MSGVFVNDPAVAALYSQLTGVLAGFAFAGLVLVITHRIDVRASRETSSLPSDRTVVTLMTSFVGLALCSLTYALAAGMDLADDEGGIIASRFDAVAIVQSAAGLAFTASAFSLMVAVHLLLIDAGFKKPVTSFSRLMCLVAVSVGILYVTQEIGWAYNLRGNSTLSHVAQWAGLICVVVTVVVAAAIRLFTNRTNSARPFYVSAGGFCGLAFVAAIASGILAAQVDVGGDHWWYGLCLAATLFTAVGSGAVAGKLDTR